MGSSRLHAADYKSLCRLLRQWRIRAKLTQRELAEKMNVVPSFIHKGEAGLRKMDTLEVCRWIDCTGTDSRDAIDAIMKISRKK